MNDLYDNLEIAIKEKYNNNEKYFFTFNSYLRHKENLDLEYVEKIISRNGLELEFVTEQTEELCEKAIIQNICSYVFIRDNDIRKKLQKIVIEKDNSLFEYIENQTEELCLIAVTNDPYALKFVKKQTKEICLTVFSLFLDYDVSMRF